MYNSDGRSVIVKETIIDDARRNVTGVSIIIGSESITFPISNAAGIVQAILQHAASGAHVEFPLRMP